MRNLRKQRIKKMVAKRANQLDALRPNWWEQIRQPLDLMDDYRCVLGQVYGHAFASPFPIPLPLLHSAILPRGFVYPTLSGRAYATACWYDEVHARRNSQAPDVIPEWMTEQTSCA